MSDGKYEIAISFAGEQREFAEELAEQLSHYGISHFYDKDHKAHLWGKDLTEELHGVYTSRSKFVVMLISKDYVEKIWCRHELRSAISEAIKRTSEFILPIKFDDAWPPGLPDTIAFLQASEHSPAQVADLLAKKLGASPLKKSAGAKGLDAAALDWTNFVFWPSIESGTATISGVPGTVRAHTKGGITVYRFIPSAYEATLDGFYSTFTDGVLSGLIVTRG